MWLLNLEYIAHIANMLPESNKSAVLKSVPVGLAKNLEHKLIHC